MKVCDKHFNFEQLGNTIYLRSAHFMLAKSSKPGSKDRLRKPIVTEINEMFWVNFIRNSTVSEPEFAQRTIDFLNRSSDDQMKANDDANNVG